MVTKRIISNILSTVEEPRPGIAAFNEADTNADTCCLGTNFIPLSFTQRVADVFPYDESAEPITNVPIVTGATAWTDMSTNETYILVFHESLYYGSKLSHSLINTNQLRHFGVEFWDNPFDPNHDLSIVHDDVMIPLDYHGTKLRFESRVPTQYELTHCVHIHMTDVNPWNPDSVILGQLQSANTMNIISHMRTTAHSFMVDNPYSYASTLEYEYLDPTSDDSILHSYNGVHTHLKERMVTQLSNVNTALHPVSDDVPICPSFVSNKRHPKLSAERLSELWGIGLHRAQATLDVTTQRGTRSAILPLSRRYRADRHFNMKRLDGKFATDTLFADIRSLNSHTCAQVYSHKCGFSVCYPMDDATGSSIGYSLSDFCNDFGIPSHLTFDGAMNQRGRSTLFMKNIRTYNIEYHISAPRRPNENPAEGSIQLLKRRWYRIMMKRNVPPRFWDYGLVWISETGNLTVSSSRYAQGRTPLEIITGETPDISEYTDFGFYDWVTYRTNAGLGENSIGRWLGVSHKVGKLMSYWVCTANGNVISTGNVQRLTQAEQLTDEFKDRMVNYTTNLHKRLEVKDMIINNPDVPAWNTLSLDAMDKEFTEELHQSINDNAADRENGDSQNGDNGNDSLFDGYIDMEVGLPRGDDDAIHHAVVKRRAVDVDGIPVGVAHNNPLLDTRQYKVEYYDGTTETLSANVIAENLLSQVDDEGHKHLMMEEIIDHHVHKNAIRKEDGYHILSSGVKRPVITTKGWSICVSWKDGSTSWVNLRELKDSYPVELADYAVRKGIQDEPAFRWWVPYTIKKRKTIIAKLKSKYWQRTHKYGIQVPKTIKEALDIDKRNNNTVWRDAMVEEMKRIKGAFKEYDGDPSNLVGYQEITTHMIFDIKLGENFRRKARLVADGHKTDPPNSVTYSSVVSRDSVRICLLIAALNDLDVQSGDIENAYLTAKCREKCWTRGNAAFGSDKGKVFIVTNALYGLKTSGAAFRAHLASRLDEMGFKSSISDPDVWLRSAVKPDGEQYYEYILCYVDDVLCISHDATTPLKEIAEVMKFKKNLIVPPQIYLGARLEKKKINDRECWTMSSKDYVKAILDNLLERLEKLNMRLPTKVESPMASNYLPELDDSEELDQDGITMYQELIGELRWSIEIGRVDILYEVSQLSAYQASPRHGHLEQLLHIFAFLKRKPKITLYFDPSLPKIEADTFTGSDSLAFREQYRDAVEELPSNMPKPKGRSVVMTAFVDASHASNKVTRRSYTGFVIFVNRAPILWYSKRQNTIEASTFSSKFIALKICMEHITALRYKLRMFGVPIDGPADVLCDNMSVVNNSSKVESVLNKKHSSIAYHAVRWAVAAGVLRVGKIHTDDNIADAYTKKLTVAKRNYLFGNWTY